MASSQCEGPPSDNTVYATVSSVISRTDPRPIKPFTNIAFDILTPLPLALIRSVICNPHVAV